MTDLEEVPATWRQLGLPGLADDGATRAGGMTGYGVLWHNMVRLFDLPS